MPRLIKGILAVGLAAGCIGLVVFCAAYLHFDRTLGELLRYAEHRLDGHTRLELVSLPIIHSIRSRIERPIPDVRLPTLGKGNQPGTFLPVSYADNGQPQDAVAAPAILSPVPSLIASSAEDLLRMIGSAQAGDTIEISPGHYRLQNKVATGHAGTPENPIVIRAREPGTVTIEFATEEGFHVLHPYWVFENLIIQGICRDHGDCEHAFHIVGPARGTVIRNNLVQNFNAHIKINGSAGNWPDDGLIQFNTLTNTQRRETDHPVTPIDIVGASRWRVVDNVISNFVKGGGNLISYGVFMKGASSQGRIERNLIVCTDRNISQPGVRVGLSFGGGGTGQSYCRDPRCAAEHSKGFALNNIIAHCNDFGIDVNRSNQITIAHNTLINTSGIDIRSAPASAIVYGNLLDGQIRARDDGWLESLANHTGSLSSFFGDADRLDLSWRRTPKNISTAMAATNDFCNRARTAESFPGAFGSDAPGCPNIRPSAP